jgi:hypothetical protein
MIKSKIMRWAECIACVGEMRNTQSEGKNLGIDQIILKWILKK